MKLSRINGQTGRASHNFCYSELVSTLLDNYVISGGEVQNSTPVILKICNRFSLRIQTQLSGTFLTVKGAICRANGSNMEIPEQYRSFLLKTLQKQNPPLPKFSIHPNNHFLLLTTNFKVDPIIGPLPQQIATCIQTIHLTFPLLRNALSLVGLASKFFPNALKIKKAKLALLKTVYDLAKPSAHSPINFCDSQASLPKGCVFKSCHAIQSSPSQDQALGSIQTSKKTGGYFEIEKKNCQVTEKPNNSPYGVDLAIKVPRKDRSNPERQREAFVKINKEFRILNEIIDRKHTLTYWRVENQTDQQSKIMMDYVSETLNYNIHATYGSVEKFVDLAEQVICGVSILHKSGIVHRDLKPENILLEQRNDKRMLKIIDFGESALASDEFRKSKECILGSTIPYSPVECTVISAESFNSPKIDLWSVGVILYEMFFKKTPISYSKCFASEIYRGWKIPDQFSIFPSCIKGNGIQVVSWVVYLLATRSICVKQTDRLELSQMEGIIKGIKTFLKQVFY